MPPTLGLAIPVYDDWDGVYFTVMAALTYHGTVVDEIVVADTNPDSKAGDMTGRWCLAWAGPKVRYVAVPDHGTGGPAGAKNRAIAECKSDIVVCVDAHVLLRPGCPEAVKAHLTAHPTDLVHGPLHYDGTASISTHFNDVWGGGMSGQWTTEDGWQDKSFFEVNNAACGFFAVRRDQWLGFNPKFRGFGGEEGYIQAKYRKAGRRAVCVTAAGWVHRFGRVNGVPHVVDNMDKMRNYVIGRQELGLPLDDVRSHFVSELVSAEQFDAVAATGEPKAVVAGCGGCGNAGATAYTDMEQWYTAVRDRPSDINEHLGTLRLLARDRVVVDKSNTYTVSGVALAIDAKEYYTATRAGEAVIHQFAKLLPDKPVAADTMTTGVRPCDLLFLDTDPHDASSIAADLINNHEKVSRYIIIHDTKTFGEKYGDAPGLLPGVRLFVKQFPQWSVVQVYTNNNGLIVLSKNDEDKKTLPGLLTKAKNYALAVVEHVKTGAKDAPPDIIKQRMDTCLTCPMLNNGQCGQCGCPVAEKTKWAEQQCPVGYW